MLITKARQGSYGIEPLESSGLMQSRCPAHYLDLVILSEAKNLADTDYLASAQSQEYAPGTRFFTSFRMTRRTWAALPGYIVDFASAVMESSVVIVSSVLSVI